MSVTDLATDINQLEEAVYQLILRQIQDSGDTSYFSDYDKTVLDWIERSVFYNAKGVTIVFNTYDIAPYSAGEQAFFIPYDLVNDLCFFDQPRSSMISSFVNTTESIPSPSSTCSASFFFFSWISMIFSSIVPWETSL